MHNRSIHALSDEYQQERRIASAAQQQQSRSDGRTAVPSTHTTSSPWSNQTGPTFASVVGGWTKYDNANIRTNQEVTRPAPIQPPSQDLASHFGMPSLPRSYDTLPSHARFRVPSPWLPPSFGPSIDGFRYKAPSPDGSVNGENERFFDWRVASSGTDVTVPSIVSGHSPHQLPRQPLSHLSSNSLSCGTYSGSTDPMHVVHAGRAIGHRTTASASAASLSDLHFTQDAKASSNRQGESESVRAWVQGQNHAALAPSLSFSSTEKDSALTRITDVDAIIQIAEGPPMSSGDMLKEMALNAAALRKDHPVIRIDNVSRATILRV